MSEEEALAKALWQMFAVGTESQKWDDYTRSRWIAKARRVLELRDRFVAQ